MKSPLPSVLAGLALLLAGCAGSGNPIAPAFARYTASRSEPQMVREGSAWSVVSSPNRSPQGDDLLYGVSAVSSSDIWAVGSYCCVTHGSQQYSNSLIEHWNGATWRIVPFPSDEPADSELRGVAAINAHDIWAVGFSVFPNAALIEHWNGKKWSVAYSPSIPYGAELNAVVAISAKDVWAVGEGNDESLTEHWDGKQWSYVSDVTQGLTFLQSVAASGPDDVWAVGKGYGASNGNAFAEHWNGSRWSYSQVLNHFAQSSFSGVAVLSPRSAWAVGYEASSDDVLQTLTEHWDGSQWTVTNSPNMDPSSGYNLDNWLFGVAAQSASDVWAVGYWTYFPGSGTPRSLFERWNGKTWKLERGPSSLESSNNAAFNQLLGITSVEPGVLWGVGYQGNQSECVLDCTLTVRTNHG
jgi:hypothetical protein